MAAICSSCQSTRFSEAFNITAQTPDFAVFEDTVKPVLVHRCIHCHNNDKPSAGLNFQDRKAVLAGNDGGQFLVPGKPEQSRIWLALERPADHPRTMPADGWGIDKYDMEAFKAWIESGANWPTGEKGKLSVEEYQVTRRGYL